MSRDGQELERLVEELETLLLHAYGLRPEQLRVIRRHRVKGARSGALREVDVAVFADLGIREMFIAVECRDRKGPQGVDWIDQLAQKQEDIRADRMVAVSSGGFGKEAAAYAREKRIELYILDERSNFTDGNCLAQMELVVSRPKFRVQKFSWSRRGAVINFSDPMPSITDEEAAALTEDFEGKNWTDTQSHSRVSLNDVLSATLTWDRLMKDTPDDGTRSTTRISTDLKDRYILARDFRVAGWLYLASITTEFETWWEPELVPADRVVQYRTAEGAPVVELHEYSDKRLGLDGQTLWFAPIAGKTPESR